MATATPQYVGNNDFRGYISYLAANTSNPVEAAGYKNLLGVVGNDGKLNTSNFQGLDTPFGYSAGSNGASKVQGDVSNLYNNWQNNVLGASNSTGGSTTPDTSQSDLAYLDSQDGSLRQQLTSADQGLNDGLTQLEDTYNQQHGRTTADQATADDGFNTQRTQTTQDKLKAVDSANMGGYTLANSVRRILGLAGGSNSSAFQVAAPKLIADDTTSKRQGINDTFTRNYGTIDSSQNATDTKFSRALQDLADQRKQKEEGLRSGILQQEQDIQSQLGQNALTRTQINGGGYAAAHAAIAPSQNAVADNQSKIDALFGQFRTPYAVGDTAPVAANTDSYTVNPTALNTGAGAGTDTNGDNTPILSSLLKKFQGQAVTPAAA
jgi:hypothetical protein